MTARKPAVGVGATWQFAGTPPSLAASTHVRDSGEALNDHKSLHAELVVKVPLKRFGFADLGLKRIIGLVMPENIASVRVLEKTGLRYIGSVSFWGHQFSKYVIDA